MKKSSKKHSTDRCAFRVTECGDVPLKRWRCSRRAKHTVVSQHLEDNTVQVDRVCTQHMKHMRDKGPEYAPLWKVRIVLP